MESNSNTFNKQSTAILLHQSKTYLFQMQKVSTSHKKALTINFQNAVVGYPFTIPPI